MLFFKRRLSFLTTRSFACDILIYDDIGINWLHHVIPTNASTIYLSTRSVIPIPWSASFWKHLLRKVLNSLRHQREPYSYIYISTLFDRFAPDFDAQLTGELEYRAPKILASTIKGHLTEGKIRLDILDLGCGTGLGGVAFKKLAKRIDGVDLSGEMLKLARKRRIYKHLTKSDIITHLNRVNRKYDLVTGADVFVYFGALNALFAGVERILKPGGFLVFSVESNKNSSFELTPSGRYVHGRSYVRKVAKWGGLNECSVNREIVRQEYGEPVFGDIWVFKAHGERAS